MHIPVPKKGAIEWNLNTIVMAIGFAFTWGVGWQALEGGRATNAASIARIEQRVDRLEGTQRTLENHEVRLSRVETQAVDAASAMRSVEQALSQLSSDIRLTREILERLERSQNGNRPQ